MCHKHAFNAVEMSVRDCQALHFPDLNEIPFGIKKISFGGDFRQMLPVIKKGRH
jgi:hypothetical protein